MTSPDGSLPPDSIRRAFRAPDTTPVQLGAAWDDGWLYDTVVISAASDTAAAKITGEIVAQLTVDPVIHGFECAASVRSTDGRWSISGWKASAYREGTVRACGDEIAAAALRLDDALASIPVPAALTQRARAAAGSPAVMRDRNDASIFAAADAAAFAPIPTLSIPPENFASDATTAAASSSGTPIGADPHDHRRAAVTLAASVARHTHPIDACDQITHADMLRTTIFTPDAAPVVTQLVPVAHPRGYTCALSIVDSLIAGMSDSDLLRRFSHVPHVDELARRALLYRLYIHALHPHSQPSVLARLADVADILTAGSSETL